MFVGKKYGSQHLKINVILPKNSILQANSWLLEIGICRQKCESQYLSKDFVLSLVALRKKSPNIQSILEKVSAFSNFR